ncbi:MAG TPA: hypothetical protein VK789_01475 [Bryobacteraceae bacterium]|nr:hypothetical protein [Bryobacteraceae bacterium]
MSAEIPTVKASFVAVEEFERMRIVAEGTKGEGRDGGGVFGRFRSAGLTADLVIRGGLFHAPNAQLAPADDGHVLDERGFDGYPGLEFFVESGQQLSETLDGFSFENDCAGEQAVNYGVTGRGWFAFGSFGAVGFGSVAAGCMDLTFGTHTTTGCISG